MTVPRYYVRIQLVEQQGFDEDNPQITVLESKTLGTPSPEQNRACIVFNTVNNLWSTIKNVRDYL